MAAKFFTGLPLDGPDPECVQGYGEAALTSVAASPARPPTPSDDHSHRTRRSAPHGSTAVPVTIGPRRLAVTTTATMSPPQASPPAHGLRRRVPLAGFTAR